ncbi:hybrid sensor histidine kinase/response regulator [Exilibacterium tricleocarpae]|uniref:histidine kinase n=1 Tax=Exilibacterium tricleocarpae TaxID=2591008 RepID=A0A545SY89_9GAMM|nr:hybrid sensor histidine kinase/response regulator [Exilibacterium tricleocarpae]TQV69928.1 hybrid sensor histidine kinase/response regulator [Exilibacterium tricleocarpae]
MNDKVTVFRHDVRRLLTYTIVLIKATLRSSALLWLFLRILCFLLPVVGAAAKPLVLMEQRDHYDTLGYLEYLEDKTGKLALSDVGPISEALFTNVEQSANFGFGNSVYWFRLSVTNTHPQQPQWWLEVRNPALDLIDAYIFKSGTVSTHTQTGALVPISTRPIGVRNPVINLDLATDEVAQIYLRVETKGVISVPIFISRPEVFAVKESHIQALIGLCYGTILALLLYNLILFISTRDVNYFYYCLCVGSCGIFQFVLDGLAHEHIWPGNGALNRPTACFLIGLCIATTLQFTRSFLRGAEIFPKLNQVILTCSVLVFLYGSVWFAVEIEPLTIIIFSVLSFGVMLLMISATVIALHHGIVEARYLLIAWICLLLGVIGFNLMVHGKVAANFFTFRSIQIGTVLVSVLLSFGLAHRMRVLMQENTRIQTEAKINLERRVRERTLELDHAMSELGKANKLLRDSNVKAEEANQAKSEFIAAASHDLRQPLQALGFYLRILYDKSPGVDEVLAKCRSAFTALESLLKSLLDISKLDSNTVQANFQHIAINDIFERLKNANDYAARLKGLRLIFRGTRYTVFTDTQQLERILSNLINNAIRYTTEGGILVCSRRREHYLLLQVWDTGPGIPDAEHDNIFREFYQLKNRIKDQSQLPGLGLGLAIVKRLATLLGIPMSLRSTLGKGVVFSLQVPYGHVTKSPLPPIHTPDPSIDHHMVALVIDDDASIRDSMTLLIESWGGAALAVGSSNEAMRVITEEQITPDIIIADYQLGENESGVELVKALYAELQQSIPTIIITGETSKDSIEAIRSFGKDFIHKPVAPDKLKQIVSNLINRPHNTPTAR